MTVRRPFLRLALLAGLLAILAAGCASDSDLTSLRKEQRDLARRLADTRADVESLRVQLSRLRGQVEEGGQRGRAAASAPSSDIEERLRVLESSTSRPAEPGAAAAPGSVPAGSEFASAPPPAPAPSPPPAAPPASETGSPVSVESDLGRS